MPQPQKNGIAEREEFQLLPQSGGSVLIGRFQVGDRMILLSHQQWEGDSDLLSERQREEILRRTLVERLRKENPQLKI